MTNQTLQFSEAFNMWKQNGFKADAERVAVKPFTPSRPPASQAGTHSVFSTSQSSPLGDNSWQDAPCFCLRHAMPATRSRSSCSAQALSNHSAVQAATEARQGGVLSERTGGKKSSRETCLLVREEIKKMKKEKENKMGRKRGRESFTWRESRQGGGQRGVTGGGGGRQHAALTGPCIYAIDISTHQLVVIALAHKLHTYFTQTGA